MPQGVLDLIARKRILTYHVLEDHAKQQPNHPFLIFENRTWSYKEFFEAVMKTGNWLMKDLEIQEGEIVAIDGGNSPEYLMLWFALEAIGAVVSFINYNLTGAGLVHCIKVSVDSTLEPTVKALTKVALQYTIPDHRCRCKEQCRALPNRD